MPILPILAATVVFAQDVDSCRAQPDLAWCAAPAQASVSADLSADLLRSVEKQARQRFIYRDDPPGHNHWESHRADVASGKPWEGNCDKLTYTELDILSRQGVDPSRLWRVIVSTPEVVGEDHMVGLVEDNAGSLWVIGDTSYGANGAPYIYHSGVHHWTVLYASNVGRDGFRWEKGDPFSVR